jgi:hypothetical protein
LNLNENRLTMCPRDPISSSAVSARLTGPMLVDSNPFSKLTKVYVSG